MKFLSFCIIYQLSLIFAAGVDENPPKLNQKCLGDQGRCVYYYLCNNGTIIDDGAGIIIPRFDEAVPVIDVEDKGPCEHQMLRCCKFSKIKTATETPPLTIDNTINPACGFRNAGGIGFVLGSKSNEAEFGEFPWTLAIFDENSNNKCGASLLSENVALTAAHCVHNKPIETYFVRAGEWDKSIAAEIYPHADYKIQDVIIHENFYKGGLHNDIALIIFKTPVKLAQHINTICLPPQDYDVNKYKNCFVTGWGKDDMKGKYADILKRIEPPIIPFNECQDNLRKTAVGIDFKLHESFLCAGDEQNDSCQGDGGSALFCPIEGNPGYYYQAGIVAWGMGCKTSTGGVYVNVAKFRSWIDGKMKSKNFPTTRYESAHREIY